MHRKLKVVSLVGVLALGFGGLAVAQSVPKITNKAVLAPKSRELQGKPKNLHLIATLPQLKRLSGAAHGVFDVGSTLHVSGRNLPARGGLVMRVASLSGTFADITIVRWSATEVLGRFEAAHRTALFGTSATETDAVVGLYDPRARSWISNTLRLRVRAERPRATSSRPDADGDGAIASELGGLDCDDTDPNRFPGQTEICDDRDDDCDPTTVGDRDADRDGFVDCACTNEGRTADFCDCDDRRADVHYGNPETCDGVDNDCDGAIDEGVGILLYVDGDGDGYGAGAARQRSCELRPGLSVFGNDCDDRDAKKTPLSGCP